MPTVWKNSYVDHSTKEKAPGKQTLVTIEKLAYYHVFIKFILGSTTRDSKFGQMEFGFRNHKSNIDASSFLRDKRLECMLLENTMPALLISKMFDTVEKPTSLKIDVICRTNYLYIVYHDHRFSEIAQSRCVAKGDKLSL